MKQYVILSLAVLGPKNSSLPHGSSELLLLSLVAKMMILPHVWSPQYTLRTEINKHKIVLVKRVRTRVVVVVT